MSVGLYFCIGYTYSRICRSRLCDFRAIWGVVSYPRCVVVLLHQEFPESLMPVHMCVCVQLRCVQGGLPCIVPVVELDCCHSTIVVAVR